MMKPLMETIQSLFFQSEKQHTPAPSADIREPQPAEKYNKGSAASTCVTVVANGRFSPTALEEIMRQHDCAQVALISPDAPRNLPDACEAAYTNFVQWFYHYFSRLPAHSKRHQLVVILSETAEFAQEQMQLFAGTGVETAVCQLA